MDESQNTSVDQMKMFLTRMGFGSYAVINGDMTQIDLPKNIESGLSHVLKVLDGLDDIGFTTFNSDLKNQFCVDREKFPLVPNSVYGNKMIKGYENAMRTISIEEVLGRVNEILLD